MGGDRGTDVPIRVLLADDHTMFRQGLAGVLASYGGLEVVAEVPNDALALARELRPDVVVMQVQMPFERTRETLSALRAFPDPPKVVIVTMFESPRYIRELTGLGASAYLLKSSSADHLAAAARAAVLAPEGGRRGRRHAEGDAGEVRGRLRGGADGQGAGSPAPGLPRPPQRPRSLLAAHLRGDRQAPPRQRLLEERRREPGRGHARGAAAGLDHRGGGQGAARD